MDASVIVRTKDEAPRLRLTLASLAMQTHPVEVVVVNDGSSDETADVIAGAHADLNLKVVTHQTAKGRSEAANAGARAARGAVLLFLDGDTLAAPDLVESHMRVHREDGCKVVRGETWHLRGARLFRDPETGAPMAGQEDKVARLRESELERSRITMRQIREDFAALERRAQPGIYPGYGPRVLFDLEMAALREGVEPQLLWIAASGSNQSVSRDAFLSVGGFHPHITINEHRELALRLCQRGNVMAAATGKTFHLIHRSGWRDPLEDRDWEQLFYSAHPLPEVALMSLLWESLSDRPALPEAARITSIAGLARAAERQRGVSGLSQVKAAHLEACREGAVS